MTAPVPATPDLPPTWRELDSIGSYYAAIEEIGRRVKAGEPVPEFLLPRKVSP